MENASKALLIAGSALLMILLLSFAIFMFQRIGAQSQDFYDNLSVSTIDEFNQKFLNYDNKDNLRIQDVVTLINLAKDNNDTEKFPVKIIVTFLSEDKQVQEYSKEKIQDELLMQYMDREKDLFTCKVEFDKDSRLVGKIHITKTP